MKRLALILFPESLLFNNLPMQAACSVDALSASTWLPNDELFWCAGAQGTMYPLTGSVGEYIGGVQGTVLLSERLIYKLHRLGLMADSSIGDLCSAHTTMTLPKSRYRYQMINPIPTVTPDGCQPFGRTTMLWGSMLEPPISTENYGYLIFRKRNCCFDFVITQHHQEVKEHGFFINIRCRRGGRRSRCECSGVWLLD